MLGIHTKPSLYRDFALLSVLIIFILLLVSVWIVYKTYQNHTENVLNQLENEALRIDRALIIEIEQASYLLESIGRQIEPTAPNASTNIIRLFDSFSSSKQLQNSEFYWINIDQEVIISRRMGQLDKPIDISDRDYMKRAITAPWTVHIGQPVEGRVSHEWVIPIAMGITDAEDQFLGAVSISLSIDALSQKISNVIKEPDIDFAITNTAFTLLTEIAARPEFFREHFSLNQLANLDLMHESSGVFSTAGLFDKNAIYAYYEHSSQYPYIIFVGYDAESSRSAIDGILVPRLLQIGVMTLFLVLTLWTVRKRIIQPVMLLTEHTTNILKGKAFDHDTQHDPVEIEQLAEEIKRLGFYVEERRRIEKEMARKNNELMKIREAAEMTNHLKAKFFEQVGDALMQPAKSISEYVESMRNELFGPLGSEKYQEMTEQMSQESASIMDTLADISAISKAESGLLALNDAPMDLSFVIKKCVRLLRESTPFQHVEVILDLDETIPKVEADELRIKQLILNLMTTAANEIDAYDTLHLNTEHVKEGVRIEVIYKPSPSATRRMDAPYSQTGSKPTSAGFLKLGHALSELIIAMHGGEITTKAMPDNLVKKAILIPEKRVKKSA